MDIRTDSKIHQHIYKLWKCPLFYRHIDRGDPKQRLETEGAKRGLVYWYNQWIDQLTVPVVHRQLLQIHTLYEALDLILLIYSSYLQVPNTCI